MIPVNKMLVSLSAIGVGLSLVGSAYAQAPAAKSSVPTAKLEKPIRIKLGAFFPTDGDIKDGIGSTFFSYGASYDFLKTNVENPITVGVYLDGSTASKKNHGITDRLSYLGVGPIARYYFTPISSPTRFYGGAGIGVYFLNLKSSVTVEGTTFSESTNKSRFGGKLLAGVESGQGLFGELDYTVISKIEDTNPSGFGVSVGYRF